MRKQFKSSIVENDKTQKRNNSIFVGVPLKAT